MPDEKSKNTLLLEEVYSQLRAIAQKRLATEAPGHTLQATALVHEAWIKLSNRDAVKQLDRGGFLVAAAEAMRQVLIDHARSGKCVKRGGERQRLATDVAELAIDSDAEQIVALDDAINHLEREEPQSAKVVKLRFFAGLSVAETAEVLGLSERTVKRNWQYARAWLFEKLS